MPPTTTWIQKLTAQGDLVLAGGVFALLAIMLVPLPGFAIDGLITASIAASLLLFLSVLSVRRPVDLSAFPILLLVTTVFRLALNVATTRAVLLHGAEGHYAAGRIIAAMGEFVIGGNYIVGAVVFTILIVINFVVVTKGAGRVAEVAARFTLDAMPGKQMSVDAELNSGSIDEKTARHRRAEIAMEADFYGSMDGASKFVRGDAIAGIAITLINALGGVLIGTLQHGMPLADAMKNYTLLTIGDGLASQVPTLIVSLAAALLVTRVNDADKRSLHSQVGGQLFSSPRLIGLLAGCLAAFAVIPGLTIPFLLMAAAVAWFGWQIANQPADKTPPPSDDAEAGPRPEVRPEDLLPVEPLAIEVGLDLLYLVDEQHGAELVQRIQRIRNQFAQDLGVVMPRVHLRDNLRLQGGEYAILLRGEEIARGKVHARQHLALDPGGTLGPLKGLPTKDPVFGLPAWWIPDALVVKAQTLGYTVVDVPTVMSTHLVEVVQGVAHELFDTSQLAKALERVGNENPRLVEDLIPDPLGRNAVLRVFRNLVREGVSVRDTVTILEALGDYAGRTRDPDVLTEFVRQRLARVITRKFSTEAGVLRFVGLAPDAEDAVLLRGLQTQEGGPPALSMDPDSARRLITRVRDEAEARAAEGPVVLLAPPLARAALRRLLERSVPRLPVVSSAELLPTVRLERVALVDLLVRSDINLPATAADIGPFRSKIVGAPNPVVLLDPLHRFGGLDPKIPLPLPILVYIDRRTMRVLSY
ncbi:MAG: flagellar biosynthesis protein FlhA, partial [Myxococcota bacterium]